MTPPPPFCPLLLSGTLIVIATGHDSCSSLHVPCHQGCRLPWPSWHLSSHGSMSDVGTLPEKSDFPVDSKEQAMGLNLISNSSSVFSPSSLRTPPWFLGLTLSVTPASICILGLSQSGRRARQKRPAARSTRPKQVPRWHMGGSGRSVGPGMAFVRSLGHAPVLPGRVSAEAGPREDTACVTVAASRGAG